jgi:hypothetical protein
MTLRKSFSLMTFLLLLACATSEPPKFDFAAGTRVGIINHLEDYATHRNFSSLRFDSFSKRIDVDWDIPGYIGKKLSDALRAGQRYSVSGIKPDNRLAGINQEPELSHRTVGSRTMKDKMVNYLGSLADNHQLDVIISIRSYSGPSAVKIDDKSIELQGYGLFTRQLLMSKHAHAYANIAVEVFKTRPLTFIGSGIPGNRKSSLDNIELAGSLNKLPRSEIEKIEPLIKEYADQAAEKALVNSNLLPPVK